MTLNLKPGDTFIAGFGTNKSCRLLILDNDSYKSIHLITGYPLNEVGMTWTYLGNRWLQPCTTPRPITPFERALYNVE